MHLFTQNKINDNSSNYLQYTFKCVLVMTYGSHTKIMGGSIICSIFKGWTFIIGMNNWNFHVLVTYFTGFWGDFFPLIIIFLGGNVIMDCLQVIEEIHCPFWSEHVYVLFIASFEKNFKSNVCIYFFKEKLSEKHK